MAQGPAAVRQAQRAGHVIRMGRMHVMARLIGPRLWAFKARLTTLPCHGPLDGVNSSNSALDQSHHRSGNIAAGGKNLFP